MATTYCVEIKGTLPGQSPGEVVARLSSLFKVPIDKAAPLLGKPGAIIKRGVDFQTAAKYVAALQKAGCAATVTPEVEPSADAKSAAPRTQPAALGKAAAAVTYAPSPYASTQSPIRSFLENQKDFVGDLFERFGRLFWRTSNLQRASIGAVALLVAIAGAWLLFSSPKDSPELVAAVAQGDTARVEHLLAAGANPNSRGGDQNMPVLIRAALQGNAGIVKSLLRAGANSKVTHAHLSPLAWATMGGTPSDKAIEVVRMLVAKGADLDEQDSQGYTALHRAVRNPSANGPLAIALVAMGADVNIKDKNGKTAITLATEYNASQDLTDALKDRKLAERLVLIKSETGTGSSLRTQSSPPSLSVAANPMQTISATQSSGLNAATLAVSTSAGRISLSAKGPIRHSQRIGDDSRDWEVKLGDNAIHAFESSGTPDFFNAKSPGKQPVLLEGADQVAVAIDAHNDMRGTDCATGFIVVLQRNGTPHILNIPNDCSSIRSVQLQDGKLLFTLYGNNEPDISYQDGALTDLAYERAAAGCRSLGSYPGSVLKSYDYQRKRDFGLACQLAAKKAPKNEEMLYLYGRYVDYAQGDYAEAVKIYRASADLGHAGALASLGRMYVLGLGVTKDPAEALKLWRLAAEKKSAIANRDIGRLYLEGMGVEKDLAQARQWLARAEELEPGIAKDDLAQLEGAECLVKVANSKVPAAHKDSGGSVEGRSKFSAFALNGMGLGLTLAQIQGGYPRAQDKWWCMSKPVEKAVGIVVCSLSSPSESSGVAHIHRSTVDRYVARFLDGKLARLDVQLRYVNAASYINSITKDFVDSTSAKLGPPSGEVSGKSQSRYHLNDLGLTGFWWGDGENVLTFDPSGIVIVNKVRDEWASARLADAAKCEVGERNASRLQEDTSSSRDVRDQVKGAQCSLLRQRLAGAASSANPQAREVAHMQLRHFGCE